MAPQALPWQPSGILVTSRINGCARRAPANSGRISIAIARNTRCAHLSRVSRYSVRGTRATLLAKRARARILRTHTLQRCAFYHCRARCTSRRYPHARIAPRTRCSTRAANALEHAWNAPLRAASVPLRGTYALRCACTLTSELRRADGFARRFSSLHRVTPTSTFNYANLSIMPFCVRTLSLRVCARRAAVLPFCLEHTILFTRTDALDGTPHHAMFDTGRAFGYIVRSAWVHFLLPYYFRFI